MDLIKTYAPQLILALIAIAFIQFVAIVSLSSRLGRTARLVRSLLTGPGGEDLEEMLNRCLEESRRALDRGDTLEAGIRSLADEMQGCVQMVGLVRYDAFGDVSGEQSFSAALLDGHRNGAIITGLFGRQDSRCYGKQVLNGSTQQELSDEENAALQMALNGGIAAAQDAPIEPRSRRERQKING